MKEFTHKKDINYWKFLNLSLIKLSLLITSRRTQVLKGSAKRIWERSIDLLTVRNLQDIKYKPQWPISIFNFMSFVLSECVPSYPGSKQSFVRTDRIQELNIDTIDVNFRKTKQLMPLLSKYILRRDLISK